MIALMPPSKRGLCHSCCNTWRQRQAGKLSRSRNHQSYSGQFSGKQTGEALRRLLGDYSYALVPETNTHAKFFVFRTSREQATRAIQPLLTASKSSTNRIGNELIVTLKPGEKIEDLAKRLGAKSRGRSEAQNTYRLRFDDDKSAETARAAYKTIPPSRVWTAITTSRGPKHPRLSHAERPACANSQSVAGRQIHRCRPDRFRRAAERRRLRGIFFCPA